MFVASSNYFVSFDNFINLWISHFGEARTSFFTDRGFHRVLTYAPLLFRVDKEEQKPSDGHKALLPFPPNGNLFVISRKLADPRLTRIPTPCSTK